MPPPPPTPSLLFPLRDTYHRSPASHLLLALVSIMFTRLSRANRLLAQPLLKQTTSGNTHQCKNTELDACSTSLPPPTISSYLSSLTDLRPPLSPFLSAVAPLHRRFAHLVPATPGNPALTNTNPTDDAMSGTEAQFGYSSQDALFEENRLNSTSLADPTNRTFTYLMQGSAAFMYASFGRLAVMKFVSYLSASADVMAVATMEVEIGAIAEGNASTVKWRGKPVFIRHRTAKEIHAAQADDHAALRDPQTDAERFHDRAEWAILIGVCTHLGCGQ